MTQPIDTSPARLRELAERLWVTATSDDRVAAHHLLLAIADEKEDPPEGKCPTCGSDCNERDELEKAEREIEKLRAEKEAAGKQEPYAWCDPTNTEPSQAVTFDSATAKKWPHKYKQPLYLAPPPSEAAPVDVPLPEGSFFLAGLEGCAEKGWVDCMAWKWGEFTTPLFTAEQMRDYAETVLAAERIQAAKKGAT